MPVVPDIQDDFALVDGLENIEIASGGSTQSEIKSLFRQVTTTEAEASGGKYTTDDSVFIISDRGLEVNLEVGGTVTESGEVFDILGVRRKRHTHRYMITGRSLAVLGTLTIQTKTFEKNDDGVQEPTWADTEVDIPGAIHEVSALSLIHI